MAINTDGATASLFKSDGGTFSIDRISLAYAFAGNFGVQSFTFIGELLGGATITQTFTIGPQEGRPFFEPFLFGSEWNDLVFVDFSTQHPSYYQFTNVVLGQGATVIPEPASIALLGTGLVGVFGVGAVRRRRRNGSA